MQEDSMYIGMLVMIIFISVVVILMAAGMWRIFEKAGEPGWACLVPIYNLYVYCKIIGKPWYWMFLMCLPYIGTIWQIWSHNMLSKSFGKENGFTVGLVIVPFIFYPILGFSDTQYLGPYGDPELFHAMRQEKNEGFDFEHNKFEI